ncbi:MAG: ATP-binding protein [Clostridium sp.]|uniref:sensor histidine kinase n=1 Tax=Clostridium TaxID=1485 RepID=UPI0021522983|nr:cell wall metabolism sensor histidine kinase WalK [Clostridium sp. LY3-2]MCR6516093.1 cell wall metabolism sensor histidine kinase WalK [Clostridium sp. LY3-2]
MMSIKRKLIRNFMIVILSSIVILDLLLIFFVRGYYYDNTENMLTNQIDIATNFYDKYYSHTSLIRNVYDNVDAFWNQTTAEVQLYDDKGKLIMDSIGVSPSNDSEVKGQIDRALKGESSKWVGNVGYYSHKVMAVSKPIVVNGKTVGVIRFVTSLKEIDDSILAIISFFIGISFVVSIIAIILSLVMAKNIVDPILKLKDTAEKMADGDLDQRCNINSKDEIGQLALTLDYMAGELKEREKLKNDFISSVSHELRTPLTSIKGWTITLNDENTDKETLKLGFDIIEKESDRLSGLVEELLDFSRLVNNNITLRKQDVSIEAFSNYILNYMLPRSERENIKLTVKNNTKNLVFPLDVNRFKQVMINILDNSFKFTQEEGNITVNFSEDENNLIVSVKDDGCGIPKEELERVLEKFFKGSNANSNTGIGLSIADEIVRLHGGVLEISSELYKGTEIIISIPKESEEI